MATTAKTTAKKTTAKKTTAKKTTAKKAAPRKTAAKKVAPAATKRATTAKKVTTASAKPVVDKVAPKPAPSKVEQTRDNLLALLPFELPKFELPFDLPKLELPKVELPKFDDVQSRFEDFVIDLRERTHTGELRKGVENAVDKVRATVGR